MYILHSVAYFEEFQIWSWFSDEEIKYELHVQGSLICQFFSRQ